MTIGERKRILTTHIFGVDIDPQAVEVTKLSLLLKVLEGETDESLGKQTQRKLFDDRALPNLDRNIKCGNSLIGADYCTGQLVAADEEELKLVKPLDWKTAFPQAMQAGGFDCIVGNPPYVLLQDEFRDDRQLEYFRAEYPCASFKLDTYHLFMERSLQLLGPSGRCSMITPANFLTNNHLDRLRRYLLTQSAVDHIVVIDGGVFPGISVDNAIFVVQGRAASKVPFQIRRAHCRGESLVAGDKTTVSPEHALNDAHCLFTGGQSASRTN